MSTVYDDYKFVTKDELTDLGLDHLIGTSLLRYKYITHELKLPSYSTPLTTTKVRSRLEHSCAIHNFERY